MAAPTDPSNKGNGLFRLRKRVLIVAGSLLFVGSMLLADYIHQDRLYIRSRTSPSTDGVVVSSNRIENISQSAGNDDSRFLPLISYRYSVNGIEYRSDRISLEEHRRYDAAEISRILAAYPQGHGVKVFYDRLEPASAFLEVVTELHSWVELFIGVLSISAAIILPIFYNLIAFIFSFYREEGK